LINTNRSFFEPGANERCGPALPPFRFFKLSHLAQNKALLARIAEPEHARPHGASFM
jgi:hypothetical protein